MKFYLETTSPIALTSFDYLYPSGAVRDNFRNPNFNRKVYRFKGAILDLGCAGGGFVKNCLEDGRLAVGLEGNDYNLKNKKFEWATIPKNLYVCDITKPFIIHTGDKQPYKFGVITAWEVFEHILEADLPQLFTNIQEHLDSDGILVISVNSRPSPSHSNPKVDLHRTKKSQEWWTNILESHGFTRDIATERYFDKDWVRKERGTFYLVLRKKIYGH